MSSTDRPTVPEPARHVPVIAEADLCVLGGSCTGVFAAIRAARLGLRVVLVERAGGFGGVATISLVNVWHSPLDTVFETPIFAGLTVETMDRLRKRNAVTDRARSPHWAWCFNPAQLMIELDELVTEHRVTPMLHTVFVAPHVDDDGKLDAVIVENKSGRGAVRARFFIDATGDADVCHRLGLPTRVEHHLQPATTCALISGWNSLACDAGKLLIEHGHAFNLPRGFAWGAHVPGSDVYMLAGTRVHHTDCSTAEGATHAEMEGRRQVRAILDLLATHAPHAKLTLQALPARIGIRETRHVACRYQLTGDDVLHGRRFDDAIANGSYRVDVHHQDKPGITLQYLDGTQRYCVPGHADEVSRWRDPLPPGQSDPTFYQVPYRCLVPAARPDGRAFDNLLVAGRMIDTDPIAHAAVRVMVNMNQTGEAAGVAAALCLQHDTPAAAVDVSALRRTLADGGSIIH